MIVKGPFPEILDQWGEMACLRRRLLLFALVPNRELPLVGDRGLQPGDLGRRVTGREQLFFLAPEFSESRSVAVELVC